ncbi:hypothetical protein JCM10450v2_001079 [Rhodotorula kratochvilovae]
MLVGFLALAPLALASSLYTRQGNSYPPTMQRGPKPRDAWVATYNAAKAAGKIPSFAPARLNADGVPYYTGVKTGEDGVCSWSSAHCFGDDDIYDAPDGMYAVGFDDGPTPQSVKLYNFLEANNQTATHFMIGSNIVNNPQIFQQALDIGGHIAVHTWSHSYMTSLTDMELLGELGWTAQAIFDHSHGLIPKFWRPPYGDADDRVRAIATEVFGLTLVGWNRDSNDWCLNEGAGASCAQYGLKNQADLEAELRGWMVGGKSPGPMGLEHESGAHTVGGFINTFSGLKDHGWDARCVPDLFNLPWYHNAVSNDGPIDTSVAIGQGPVSLAVSAPSSSSASSSISSSSSSTSMTTASRAAASAAESTASGSASLSVPSSQAQAARDTSGASLRSRASSVGGALALVLVGAVVLA